MTWIGRLTGVLLAVLLVLFTGSGCVSRSADQEGAPASTDPVPESEVTPSAADGTDLTACADGNCEILIEDTQVTIPVPGGTLSLTLAGDNRVEYEVSINGGGSSGSAQGECVSTFTLDGTGSGSTCYAEGPTPEPNPGPGELAMVVSGKDTDTPVLRLATG